VQIHEPGDHPFAVEIERAPGEAGRSTLRRADDDAVADQEIAAAYLPRGGIDDVGIDDEQVAAALRDGGRGTDEADAERSSDGPRDSWHCSHQIQRAPSPGRRLVRHPAPQEGSYTLVDEPDLGTPVEVAALPGVSVDLCRLFG